MPFTQAQVGASVGACLHANLTLKERLRVQARSHKKPEHSYARIARVLREASLFYRSRTGIRVGGVGGVASSGVGMICTVSRCRCSNS